MRLSGYHTDQATFLQRVESDASSFRPSGQLIYSYARPSPNSASKGKRKRNGNQPIRPDSDEAIEFEVYHVCGSYHPLGLLKTANVLRQLGIPLAFESTIVKCSYSFSFILREGPTSMRRKIPGNLQFCEFCSLLGCLFCRASLRYEKRKRRDPSHGVTYHFVGYSSLYPFYYFPEKVRLRLRLVCRIHFPAI